MESEWYDFVSTEVTSKKLKWSLFLIHHLSNKQTKRNENILKKKEGVCTRLNKNIPITERFN